MIKRRTVKWISGTPTYEDNGKLYSIENDREIINRSLLESSDPDVIKQAFGENKNQPIYVNDNRVLFTLTGIPYYQDGENLIDASNGRIIKDLYSLSNSDPKEREKAYADYKKPVTENKASEPTFTVHRKAGNGTYISQEQTVKEFVITELMIGVIKAIFFIITLPLSLTLWAIREDKKR